MWWAHGSETTRPREMDVSNVMFHSQNARFDSVHWAPLCCDGAIPPPLEVGQTLKSVVNGPSPKDRDCWSEDWQREAGPSVSQCQDYSSM